MGTGQFGNLNTSYSYTLGDALAKLGMTANDITVGGDRFQLGNFTANLTDGRSLALVMQMVTLVLLVDGILLLIT